MCYQQIFYFHFLKIPTDKLFIILTFAYFYLSVHQLINPSFLLLFCFLLTIFFCLFLQLYQLSVVARGIFFSSFFRSFYSFVCFWRCWVSAAACALPRSQRTRSWVRQLPCGAQAQQRWHTSWAALQPVGPARVRGQTHRWYNGWINVDIRTVSTPQQWNGLQMQTA